MNRLRPDWQQRRIDFWIARQRAKRTHPQPCGCPYCRAQDRVEADILAKIKAHLHDADGINF